MTDCACAETELTFDFRVTTPTSVDNTDIGYSDHSLVWMELVEQLKTLRRRSV